MKFGKNKIQIQQIDIHNVYVFYPASFDDIQYAIDTLAEKTPLVVSFTKADDKTMQRFLDFLSGAIYALKGHVVQMDQRDFLFVPQGIEVLFED